MYYADDGGEPFLDGVDKDNIVLKIIRALKFYVLPPIFLLGGIALVVLGGMGIMGLGLGLGLGITSIVASLSWFTNFASGGSFYRKKEGFQRGVWISYIAVAGMIAAATFLILGFAGILAWSSVLAFGAPAAFAAIVVPIVGILIESTNWIKFRGRVEELLEPVLFFGGITLTVLISLGILPFGGIGIAICSMLIFFSASRFLATNSWSKHHNYHNYRGYLNGLIVGCDYEDVSAVKFVFVAIGAIAGFALPILGAVGVFGLGLGLALGIPILSASVIGLASFYLYNNNNRKFKISISDNVWSVATAISGVIAAGVSLGLGFGGVLALPIAIAIAVPSAVFSALIGLIHGAMFWLSKTDPKKWKWLQNKFSDNDDKRPVVGFLGIGRYELKTKNKTNIPINKSSSGDTRLN